ncbi:Maestro heat-like repeat-containing protein family member 1 [Lamellibrachia satsuma]|nr:Maestro heat-like repeat-containing protein family member 1 [Lamellibrachia satsuma]
MLQDTKSECEEKCKATLLLCYGYMSLYAPVTLIPSRLETIIQKTINPQFTSVKDACVKENLIQTVELIGRAMHPTHLQMTHNFTYCNDLLLHMQNFLKTENPRHLSSAIRALTLNTCTTLIKLEPKLSDADTEKLLETALTCVLVLPPDGGGGNWLKEETYKEHMEHEQLMKLTMTALADLLKQILCKDCTPEGLEVIFKTLHAWTQSKHNHERERAMQLCVTIFTCMRDNMQLNIGTCTQSSRMGITLARLVPRCTDPQVPVREAAIDCVLAVLQIGAQFEGAGKSDPDETAETLPNLKEKVRHSDPSVLFNIVNDLAKVLIKKVPSSELMSFLSCLMDALLDSQSHSSSGACVVLNSVIKARGGELHSQVDTVLSSLHDKMREITCRQTRTGAIRAVRTLMSHQLLTVLDLLLHYPIPFDIHICECWRVIGEDSSLMASVLTYMLELLSTRLPYEEIACTRDKGRTIRTATLMPIAVTCALREIFTVEESKVEVMNCYPRLLAAMLVRIASTVGTDPPKVSTEERRQSRLTRESAVTTITRVVNIDPCSTSIDTCKQLLRQNESDDLLTALDNGRVWELLQDETTYHDGFTMFARCLAQTQPQYAAKLITSLCPVSSSIYQPQRVMVSAIIAEPVNGNEGERDVLMVTAPLSRY